MTEENKTGIIYSRVSSKDQVDNTSLESQEQRCQEYASQKGIKIARVFIERGESAKSAERTEFIKAIGFCTGKKNRVDYFLVYKLDRFARNQADHVTVRALLRRSGTELRSATEPIDESPVGKAMEGMISVFSEFDNNVRTERTKGGMLERLKQGVWVWIAPLGYLRPARHTNIAPDPKSALFIRMAFEEYGKGIYSFKSLAALMDSRGMRTRYDKKPCAQLMQKVIANPLYCGRMEVWGEVFRGTYETIVSEELYMRCQPDAIRKAAHAGPRTINNPEYPLRGHVLCSECQKPLTASAPTGRKGKRFPYYHHHNPECERARFIPKETFEQTFVEYLQAITPSLKYSRLFKAVMVDIWKTNYANIDNRNRRLRLEIAKLEDERQKVFTLHRNGTYSDGEFSEQKRLVNTEIDRRMALIEESRMDEFQMETALDHCFAFVNNTATAWLQGEHTTRLQLQKLIFKEKLSYDGQKFGNAKLSIIYEAGQHFDGNKSGLVALLGGSWNQVYDELKLWASSGLFEKGLVFNQ